MANQLKVGAPSMQVLLPETKFGQSFRARNQRNAGSNLMENIVHVKGNGGAVTCVDHQEDGVVRMKIVVRKKDIEQVLEVLRFGKSKAHDDKVPSVRPKPSQPSAEQRLNDLLRKKRLSRANNGAKLGKRSSWSPALHSIPEELQA